jgi:hypothetical protein
MMTGQCDSWRSLLAPRQSFWFLVVFFFGFFFGFFPLQSNLGLQDLMGH